MGSNPFPCTDFYTDINTLGYRQFEKIKKEGKENLIES